MVIIEKACQKNLVKRYKNINELKADLLIVAMENKNKKKSSFWSKIFRKGRKS